MANRLISTAKQNAVLRYTPQREALSNLAREAREQYASTIQDAESSGRLTSNAVANAVPAVQGIYDRAQGTTTAAQSQLASALAALGAGANGFKAAAASEGAAGQEKLARERADSESNLRTQASAAAEAPAFARTLAQGQLAKQLGKIFSSAQGIAGQESLATSTETDRLEREAKSQALTERGQNITAKSDSEGHAISLQGLSQKAQEHAEDVQLKREAGGTAGKPRLLSTDEQAKASSLVREAEHEARELRNSGAERGQILNELTSNHPAYNVPKRDKNGNILKTAKAGGGVVSGNNKKAIEKAEEKAEEKGEVQYEKTPALKAHDQLLAEAALDSVYGYGRVSRPTLQKLHAAGYSIKALQLQGPGPPPKPKPPAQAVKEALGF